MVRLLFPILILVSCAANAALTFWQPNGQSAIYILPGDVTPESYLSRVQKNGDLKIFVSQMTFSKQDRVEKVFTGEDGAWDRALLVANSKQDHTRDHQRVDQFGQHWEKSWVLPIGATLGMNENGREAFFAELANHFGTFVFMGGDDADPRLFKQKLTWAVDFNYLRDRLEADLVSYVYHKTKRQIFAVCRGMQLVAQVLGADLLQDIWQEMETHHEHRDGEFHKVEYVSFKENFYADMMTSLNQTRINSYHHQLVDWTSLKNTPLIAAAFGPDQTLEAAITLDQRVLLTQSHPEKLDYSIEFRNAFFKKLRAHQKKVLSQQNSRSCRSLF